MCSTGECGSCQALRDDGTEPAFTESIGDCACGGRLKPMGEVHTLDGLTQHLRCTDCQAESKRELPAE